MRYYAAKRPRALRMDPDRRMNRAAQLRAEGKSLREIAEVLHASHETVRRDLARLASVEAVGNVVQLSHSRVNFYPASGQKLTAECDARRGTS